MRRVLHILKDADSAPAIGFIEEQARQGNCVLHVLLIHEAVRLRPQLPEAVKVDIFKDDYGVMLNLIFDADTVMAW